MAGSVSYTVVLDACVLYPAPLRDLLLSLSLEGLFRARWTEDIHDEWIRSLLKQRPELDPKKLARTKELMNSSADDCLIENYQYLIESLALPDANDRHVLAAAIVGHADAIVSFNLKDFPEKIVATHGLEIIHPDDFILLQYDLHPVATLTAIKGMRARLKNPKKTANELLDKFEAQGLPQTCLELRKAADLI